MPILVPSKELFTTPVEMCECHGEETEPLPVDFDGLPGYRLFRLGVRGNEGSFFASAMQLILKGYPLEISQSRRVLRESGLKFVLWPLPDHKDAGLHAYVAIVPFSRLVLPEEHVELAIEARMLFRCGVPVPEHPITGAKDLVAEEWGEGAALDVDATLDVLRSDRYVSQTRVRKGVLTGHRRLHWLATFTRMVLRNGMDPALIPALCRAENALTCSPPIPESQLQAMVRELLRAKADVEDVLRFAPYTDTGHAERMAALHGEDIRCIAQIRGVEWWHWTGATWTPNEGGAVIQMMVSNLGRRLVDLAKAEQARVEGDEAKKWEKLFDQGRALENAHKNLACLKLLRSQPGIAIDRAEMDADPYLLNCANGTVDLTTGKLHAHRREDYLSRQILIDYDPGAEAPVFYAFLEQVQPDYEVREYLQRIAGYAALGVAEEQVLLLFHGLGANGKSTFVNLLAEVLGPYALNPVPASVFTAEASGPGARPDLAELGGARLIVCSELSQSSNLAEALVKQLTGGDPVKARFLYGSFFTFTPQFTPILVANRLPRIQGQDRGIWRRIRKVPWLVEIPEQKWDRGLKHKLLAEAQGVLAWVVRGALLYQKSGLREPSIVRESTGEYREDEDRLRSFFEDCLIKSEGFWMPKRAAYRIYQKWAENQGHKRVMGERSFFAEMTARGIRTRRIENKRAFVGIRAIGHIDSEFVV